jgi:hypothetical protein
MPPLGHRVGYLLSNLVGVKYIQARRTAQPSEESWSSLAEVCVELLNRSEPSGKERQIFPTYFMNLF